MKASYVAIGISTSKLFKMLKMNNFLYNPRYFFRLILLLQNAFWCSIFKRVEKKKFHKVIVKQAVPQKPVFIVGHWRTGSTFLHQLMSLDKNFATSSVYQVTVPECFISFEKYFKPTMRKMMGTKRPMDNVTFGPDAPQEDEFALLRMTLESPLYRIVFPKKSKYFLSDYESFMNENRMSEKWKQSLLYFYKKLTFGNNKQVLIKNPFHSMRIQTLCDVFPDARFIHIYRNPFDVIPSTIRMWDIIARQNCMNRKWTKPDVTEVSKLYQTMLNKIEADLSLMPEGRVSTVKYETFEKQPLEEIKRIYNEIGAEFHKELEEKIEKFLEDEKDFKKNEHRLNPEEIKIISKSLEKLISRESYSLH